METAAMLQEYGIKLAYPDVKDIEENIQLLIGADHFHQFLKTFSTVRGAHLIDSSVGHLILGQLPSSCSQVTPPIQSFAVYTSVCTDEVAPSDDPYLERSDIRESSMIPEQEGGPDKSKIIDELERFWDLSHIGITSEAYTQTEKSVLKAFQESLCYEDGRYTVTLPWRPGHPQLPDNYALAKSRLFAVLKRLRASPEILKTYHEVIEEQLERGFIEEVTPRTPIHPQGKLHYLPHHAVRKASSTTALRVVFDCSSNSPSLNQCLYSGPSLITDLGKLLLRFRLRKYATSSDIEKAFLGLRLADKDRDSTRFLWLRNPSDPYSQLVTYRFKSVLFGSTASPFLLAACLQHHIRTAKSSYETSLLDGTYVDNIIGTFEDEKEIPKYFHEVRQLFQEAGLNLREWNSNSHTAQILFATHRLGVETNHTKVLGLQWDTSQDLVTYPLRELDPSASTKRSVLKNLASVFDPLGILSPLVVRGKVLMQKMWKIRLSWDQIIPDELQREWRSLASQISHGLTLALPRQLIHSSKIELHAFSDASAAAYATVVYAVSMHNGEAVSHILMAKARVAPLKELTIPKLELMGIVLSSRVIQYVRNAVSNTLSISKICCWSDSQVCLQWLYSTKALPTFVQNRVDEIRTTVPTASFHFVEGKDNPADQPSRGTDAKYIFSTLWQQGPDWLPRPERWPVWDHHPSFTLSQPPVSQVLTAITKEEERSPIFEIKRCSSLHQVYRITALVLRFIQSLKNKRTDLPLRRSRIQNSGISHTITLPEIVNTEIHWIQTTQTQSFQSEINSLKGGLPPTVLMKQLNVFMTKGILRCDRRLKNAPLPFDTRFPILLPSTHHYVYLLVRDVHLSHHHVGVTKTIQILREKFYIPRIRQVVKKVLRPCLLCKRLQGLLYRPAPLAALPTTRVSETRVFSVVGVDYTGYFNVRIQKSVEKCYVALFTCAVSRAVHLELAFDNSTESFLRLFRRFIGRRGRPSIIYSDNATNFQAASKYLKELSDSPSVTDFFIKNHITWRFSAARTPTQGGFFERMIGLTKTCLRKTLRNTLINWEEFQTILTEVELTLNTRPLTYVSGEFLEDEPLTPSHLLTGHNLSSLPVPEEFLDTDELCQPAVTVSKRYKHVLKLIAKFNSTWRREYLLQLKQSWNVSGHPNVSIGDIVLIESDEPRLKWKLGLVTSLHTGSDGHTRSVSLKTGSGETTRGITHLLPLEIHASIREYSSEPVDRETASEEALELAVNKSPARLRRQEGTKARERIRAILTSDDL